MRIFETKEKVNFVDENNVFVGYESWQQCCEYAGYFIRKDEVKELGNYEDYSYDGDLELYSFDTSYFERTDDGDLYYGGMVTFKLVADDMPPLYLHIYNKHNGYYTHGYDSKIEDKKWEDGIL